jgi:transcriptional regulator with XRE-family HTH domain
MQVETVNSIPFGACLREWRRRRRMSQLDFALEAEISQKHLSFLESGRSVPSRDMVIRLAERLDVPLRERNTMLLAAGYAPLYQARPLDNSSLAPARAAIEQLLNGHEPFPALAVDRHWTMVAANRVVGNLLAAISDKSLLAPPANVLRLSLHPAGLAPQIANLPEWRQHLLDRLSHQIEITADETLIRLRGELQSYPQSTNKKAARDRPESSDLFVPLELDTPVGRLSFFSTTTVFGTPIDVTLSEIAIESFFPANEETRAKLLAANGSSA